jgi:hypothetical protein
MGGTTSPSPLKNDLEHMPMWPVTSMRLIPLCVFVIYTFSAGLSCSVDIIKPKHLAATVSLEFSIAVSLPSDLSASIDGAVIFKDSVSGNITFSLQARQLKHFAARIAVI